MHKRPLTFSATTNRIHMPAERAAKLARMLNEVCRYVAAAEYAWDGGPDARWLDWVDAQLEFAGELGDLAMTCQLGHAARGGVDAAPVAQYLFDGPTMHTH